MAIDFCMFWHIVIFAEKIALQNGMRDQLKGGDKDVFV